MKRRKKPSDEELEQFKNEIRAIYKKYNLTIIPIEDGYDGALCLDIGDYNSYGDYNLRSTIYLRS